MTALIAILKAVAIPVLAGGVMAGLVAAWYALSSEQVLLFLVCCGAALLIVFAALIVSAGLPSRRDRDDAGLGDDPDEHMGPLRQPGTAEKKLAKDLGRRRMLLPGERGRHAAGAPQPAADTTPTETLPALPDPEPHEPTEPVAVLAATEQPDPAFSWTTGEFELDIRLLGAGADGAA